jgi:hypothetical protein
MYDEILSKRLKQRPAWRGARDKGFIDDQIRFNQWFVNYNKEGKLPPISIIDTSHQTIDETAESVEAWIGEHQ